jgi:hypothetical protein
LPGVRICIAQAARPEAQLTETGTKVPALALSNVEFQPKGAVLVLPVATAAEEPTDMVQAMVADHSIIW